MRLMPDQLTLPNNDEQITRSLLDQLLADSRLFKKSDDYKKLLDFIICMPNFAPFNAMLLQVQKPGLSYAASAWDWRERFGRTVKQDARPLLILWPFGPVALVYDLLDTEGQALPDHVYAFPAKGVMTKNDVGGFISRMARKGIETRYVDTGDNKAGKITAVKRATKAKEKPHYIINVNQNHNPNIQFATLAHELGHLFLGHLGLDEALKVSDRCAIGNKQVEMEAESVSYLVCSRHGVESSSKSYLANYVNQNHIVDQLDIYQIMRAAGHVETLLGLGAHTRFEPKKQKVPKKTDRLTEELMSISAEDLDTLIQGAIEESDGRASVPLEEAKKPGKKLTTAANVVDCHLPADTSAQDIYGANNKLFTKESADAAREILRKKLANLNSGLDPELMQAGIQLAAFPIEAGARSFVKFVQAMTIDLGAKTGRHA